MNKKIGILLVLIGLATATFTVLALSPKNASAPSPQPPPTSTPAPQSGEFRGKIVCLPKKGGGPHTLECALGLQAEDGKHYSLANTRLEGITTEMKVVVNGTLGSPAANSTYNITGSIAVQSIRQAQ